MKAKAAHALKPGDTIGIIGGGQLGRMLAMAAARLGLKTVILEPGADCPAAQTANRHIAAAYDDSSALDEFSAACDVITYEFENIPVETVSWLADRVPLRPGVEAIAVAQDRLAEKTMATGLGLAVAPYAPLFVFIFVMVAAVVLGMTMPPYLALKRGSVWRYFATMAMLPPLFIYLAVANAPKILQTARGRQEHFKRTPKKEH